MATKDEDIAFVRLAGEGHSNRAIGRMLNVDEKTVRRGLERLGYKRDRVPIDLDTERFLFHREEPIVVEGDAMITADWHVPLYDPAFVNEMLDTANAEGIRTLVIGGDFWNFDALSQYDPKQDDANLAREHLEGLNLMRVLLENFDRIIYIWGNHDARFHKTLGFKLRFAEAMRMMFGPLAEEGLERIEFSNLDHAWVNGYYVCHPATYSRRPLSQALTLAAKIGAPVITAHSHHCAIGYAMNGAHPVAEAGGLFDAKKTTYLQRTTSYPNWTQGFAMITNGRLRVNSPMWHN